MHKPGSTIGILGGGQLGRMLALAAARLGLHCHIYSPEKDSGAFEVAKAHTCAAYEDEAALARFAAAVDVITYEFENIPARTAEVLGKRKPVHPNPKVLETTQDRLVEKNFISSLKIPVAPYAPVHSAAQLAGGLEKLGRPAVLKTTTMGYDGKGQVKIMPGDDANAAWRSLKNKPCVLEGFIKFQREVSVIAARSADGKVECFEVTENDHQNHILKTSTVPAKVTDETAKEAEKIAARIAKALDYVGVLGVEMFVVKVKGKQALMVNEIAPRVHNSGHWTLDGASVSQFEQHIRAVAGWPLAKPLRLGRKVQMTNLIGDEVHDLEPWLTLPGTSLHLYGKLEARAGRKMGHVTRVWPAK